MKKRKSSWGLWLFGLVLTAAALYFGLGPGLGTEETGEIEGVAVKRGPLLISVVERGNLEAADSVTLVSELEGQTTVLYLIEEGVNVQPGDLLCELDTADLITRRVQQEIQVQNLDAGYVKAKQNYEIQESQNESDIKKGMRECDFAELDLNKYLEGDMPQEERAAEESILLAEEELVRAEQDLEWSEKLAERGFLEQTQLDADRLARTRAEINKNQAIRELEVLEEHEFPRRIAELEADVEEKARELVRIELQAKARIVDYDADVRTSKAKLDLETDELAKIDDQISKAKLIAPVSGMVVYAVEENRRYGGGEPMQEGATVRERQEIITIPSAEGGFTAEASLHESVLEKVDIGMECRVTIDALGNQPFRSRVAFKAVLPDQNSWFANPDLRVYRTEIKLLDNDPRIRPGMSCSVEILVDELMDALYVPVSSIFLDVGKPICFVSDAGEVEKRSVEVGDNNGKHVVVTAGLAEGEIVLLSQPAGMLLQPASQDELRGGGEKPPSERGEGGEHGERGTSGGHPGAREGRGGEQGRRAGGMAHGDGERPRRPEGGGEKAMAHGAEKSTPSAEAAAAPDGGSSKRPPPTSADGPSSGRGTQ